MRELRAAAGAAERAQQIQLAAVLQDAAAHEAAAVDAAIAATLAAIQRRGAPFSCMPRVHEGGELIRPQLRPPTMYVR